MADDEAEAVQVAVRMRVFNKRELACNARRVVRMEQLEKGSKTFATNPDTEEEKEFKYDFSFQSHDPGDDTIGKYCTQNDVFEMLGRPVLGYALGGKNTCLFAYGQTGAGKSFSMLGKVGIPEDEGIIPRTCKQIFNIMEEEAGDRCRITVDIQVVEIYCEQVNDLLQSRTQWPANGYKPHLTAKDGYVVDTTKKPCFKYSHIDQAMEFADKNRSIGSHDLNPESSRAHTIYQINYSKVVLDETGKPSGGSLTSKLNLVDLAGSERTDSAGTSGQMLKEGNAINKSLTALGGCIKALSEEKKPNFRDSKLTLLLSGSMTNGKVIMIAAVSPASICYQETMSTLRFADRIKQVKIKAKSHVMVDPVEELKKEMETMRATMQAEIDQLRAGIDPSSGGEELQRLKVLLEEREREREEILKDLAEQKAMMEGDDSARQATASNISKNWSKAFQEMGVSATRQKETLPHLVNLHEDDRLNETLVYPIKLGDTWVGKSNSANPPGMEFNGIGMVQDHCKITHVVENGNPHVYIELPSGGDGQTKVNGKKLKGKVELVHQNRVWIGNNYSLRFVFPGQEECGEGMEKDPDYFYAQSEIVEHAGQSSALNHKVNEAARKVQQANIIANDLSREVAFFPKIYKNRFTDEEDVVVLCKVGVPVYAEFLWTWAKFESRLVQMTQMWTEWQQLTAKEGPSAKLPDRPPADDPFVDQDDQRIGEADAWLAPLANMLEMEADTALLSPFGNVEGKLRLKIQPCDRNGRPGPFKDDDEMDPFVDNPEELLGREIQFQINISQCVLNVDVEGGQGCRYEKCYVRYKLDMADDDEAWTETPADPSSTFNPKFNFTKTHALKVDKEVLAKLQKGRMTFQVWGTVCDSGKRAAPQAAGDRAKRADEVAAMQSKLEKMKKALDACKECPSCKYDLTQILKGVDE